LASTDYSNGFDDGKEPTKINSNCDYIRRTPQRSDPKFTMMLNLEEAFKWVKGDKILFIEDDEYYAPDYIKEVSEKLGQFDLVGIGRSKYYHLPTLRWHKHRNMGHASLAQTGFTRNFFKTVKNCMNGDLFLDIRLWRTVNGISADQLSLPDGLNQYKSKDGRGFIFDDFEKSIYIGIKGMPGRSGIGVGHREMGCYHFDKDKKVLKNWITTKEDYDKYLKIKEDLS
jgi:hypothetical protein